MPDGSLAERHSTPKFMSESHEISLIFPATEEAVRRALSSVRSTLSALSLDEFTIGSVEIVLAEVANNIVEHAYENTGNGTISLKCNLKDPLVKFEITDQGVALPNETLPAKKEHDLESDLNDLPEGGFGWGLIRDMTDSLAYRRQNGKNILRFSIPFVEI